MIVELNGGEARRVLLGESVGRFRRLCGDGCWLAPCVEEDDGIFSIAEGERERGGGRSGWALVDCCCHAIMA